MRKFTVILLIIIHSLLLFSQKREEKILDNNFRFNNGLYIDFDAVKNNSPIPPTNIIAKGDKSQLDFWEHLFDSDYIIYIDSNGVKQTIFSQEVFGFAYKGRLYIHINNSFAQIPVLGAIFHFTVAYSVEEVPYYYDPFNPYGIDNQTTTHIEVSQYILDFNTGQIMDFTPKNINLIFARDKDLYERWSKLSKRKKKKLIFVYLQEYNKNNPVKIPVN